MCRSALCLLIAPLCLGFAPIPRPRPNPESADLKQLQGEWVSPSSNIAFAVSGSRVKYAVPEEDGGGWSISEWSISLNEGKKFKLEWRAGDYRGYLCEGRYLLRGDSLL